MKKIARIIGYAAVALLCAAGVSPAAVMNDYCIVPPFIQEIAKPNLLMLIDNSASMYDLAYVDKGKKVCSTSGADCTATGVCAVAGQTCSFTGGREPYYCYDQTYSTANTYVGYFDTALKYQYNFTTNMFEEVASIPGSCAIAAATGVICKIRDNVVHVNINTTDATAARYFYASGSYLNWLTASKFDVEKQVLTGGKYVTKVCANDANRSCTTNSDCAASTCGAVTTAFLQPESRGCVGQGYVKEALTGDFVNYTTTDANTSLQIVFTVQGITNTNNPSAPAYGGQTYINLFGGKDYDYSKCQAAINAIATGGNADIKKEVESCLASTSPSTGYCQQKVTQSCTTSDPDCNPPLVAAHCSLDAARSCATDASCIISGAKSCSNQTKTCTVDGDCTIAAVKACSANHARACTVDSNCVIAAVSGHCSGLATRSCTVSGNECATGNKGTCVGASNAVNDGTCSYVATPASTGTCASTGDTNVGPCIPASGGYIGPCVLPDAAVKTKVAFQQSMQACWQVREGHAIGNDDINTVINQCSDVYGNYKTCSNNSHQTCSTDATCGAGNTCLSGPLAIGPGNPALLCGIGYEGQFYEQTGLNGAWVLKSGYSKTSTEMKDVHTQFCNDFATPIVTDPTDSPSDTATSDNLPAILSGIGVESQVGAPLVTLRARVAKAAAPSGLVQEYENKIRIGLMAFNNFGSASEVTSTLLNATKVCSNDSTKTCTKSLDCGTGNTCGNTADKDGASVLSLVGKGKCLASAGAGTATSCTKDAHCTTSGETCVPDGVGDHTTGLVNSIDTLRAATWTPFSEAFYNAIGYFAVSPSDSTKKSSRTDLRINSDDFPDAMNPSEYVCQSNNILLVTDGSATADQHAGKTSLVNVYKAVSGNVTGTCSTYAGSQDLDDLSWLARHRNINTFSKTSASTTLPQKKNEMITSYVVFNGADNGGTGDCNNTTLLTKTANNGGTDLLKTDIPEQYQTTLRKAFEAVAGGTASGTAASILSNSEGSGANILQAVFYPSKEFETVTGTSSPTSASWIGEMQNLWYYVDPYISNSSVREDTNKDNALHIVNDYVVEFQFKGGETVASLKKDTNGDGTGDTVITPAMDSRVKSQGYCSTTVATKCATDAGCPTGETCVTQSIVNADDVNSLWRAGKQLWNRNLVTTPRKLYTYLYGTSVAACGGGPFSITGLYDLAAIDWSSPDNNTCIVKKLLQATDDTEAKNIIKFVQGYDHSDYDSSTGAITGTINIGGVATKPRSRSVQIGGSKKVWKLGDIIASTPRIQSFNKLNNFHMDSPMGYGDTTYADDTTGKGFTNSAGYKARGMAYAGANDGMLHAFKLGSLAVTGAGWATEQKATLSGTGLGEEQWSFVPKNVLPYLKYLADPNYSHLYLVDGPTRLLDASIGYNDNSPDAYMTAGCAAGGSYWACKKDSTTEGNKSWRTLLIGSMGIGGASHPTGYSCSTCVKSPISDAGFSSYYALDVTDPASPQYMWEFSGNTLGFSTSGVAVARIRYDFTDGSGIKHTDTNGRWFAVIGNGPTGPIDTTYHQFKGRSRNPLSVFVLDLKTGPDPTTGPLKTFTTTKSTAFTGQISSAPIDTDRSRKLSDGYYSDDALYFGYTACTDHCGTGSDVWDGGIMRLLTGEDINPANWSLTTLISGIGPVTTAVGKLQDRKNYDLWLYTGSGRYFFKGDNSLNPGKILAVKEPCYDKVNNTIYSTSAIAAQSTKCTNEIVFSAGDFADQTSAINSMVTSTGTSKKGWFIDLGAADTTNNYGAERVITEPVVTSNGAVFFTSFMPSTDICNYGGNSYMWGMRYDNGGTASTSQLLGKALVQVSTGSFEEVNLSSALTANIGRKMGAPMVGKPPTDPPPIVSSSGNKALKRILHIQEK